MFRATGQPGWLRGSATPPEAAVRETQRATLERQQTALEASLAEVRRRLETVTGEASDPQS